MNKNERWTIKEDELVAEWYYKNKKHLLGLLPHRSLGAIEFHAAKMGLIAAKKNLLRTDFFSVPNNENCYWAGFLAADGSVGKNSRITLELQSKDVAHLEALKASLGAQTKTLHRTRQQWNQIRNYVSFSISNSSIVNDLAQHFRIAPRKSLTYTYPNISSQDLIFAFIIGYIDGDGWIVVSRHKGKSALRNNDNVDGFTLEIGACGTDATVQWIAANLKAHLGIDSNIYRQGKIAKVVVLGQKAERLYCALMAVRVPRLNRKWHASKLDHITSLKKGDCHE